MGFDETGPCCNRYEHDVSSPPVCYIELLFTMIRDTCIKENRRWEYLHESLPTKISVERIFIPGKSIFVTSCSGHFGPHRFCSSISVELVVPRVASQYRRCL